MSELDKAVKSLSIVDIQLRNSNIVLRDGIELHETDTPTLLTQSFRRPGPIRESEIFVDDGAGKCWRYSFEFAVGIRQFHEHEAKQAEEDEGFIPVVEIVAIFRALYLSTERIDEESLNAFSTSNVAFNTWPYWREYVHSTCSRIGYYPVIDVPLLKWKQNGADKK